MSLTKITNRVIEPGTITANSIAEGISLGGGVTIDQIIVTDANFANTSDTTVSSAGGYLKIYGSGFLANANVYISNTFNLSTQVTANVISSNEVRLTISATSVQTYNLFLVNVNGSIATKLNAITSAIPQPTAAWWIAGATPGGWISSYDRTIFASDTGASVVRGSLTASTTRAKHTSTGNNTYGWVGGGTTYFPVIALTTVERITFSADTAAASVRGTLSEGRSELDSVSDLNYSWFGGGNSRVDRITFSADTATASIRGPLSSSRYSLAAAGNDNYGWFGAGQTPAFSRVDRITFSSDTATASVRGPLSIERWSLAATGNDNYGWFGGGRGPSSVFSTVDRIDFAADTSTATVRGPLAFGRIQMSATGNDSFGWWAGGDSPNSNATDRLDFSNDSASATTRGTINGSARKTHSSTAGIA
jgi:hypothetical protein